MKHKALALALMLASHGARVRADIGEEAGAGSEAR